MIALGRFARDLPAVFVIHAPFVREVDIDAKRGRYGPLGVLLWPLARPLFYVAEAMALKNAQVLLARSSFMKAELERTYPGLTQPIRIVPLGVDTRRFSFSPDPTKAKRIIGLPEDAFVLLTVRRLVARTGLETLIDAAALAVGRHPQLIVVIGGSGYLEASLKRRTVERMLQKQVYFVGHISESELPLYYQAADLFVMPTAELEGFGLATIEALSCGTPVVATPVGANPELLGGLGREFLSRNAGPESLAELFDYWIGRGVTRDVREMCRRYCEARFDINDVMENVERILLEAIR
jgi:glycosyltransferase involved in cell wall biosynthesis